MAKRKKRQQDNQRSAKHYTVLLSVNTKKKQNSMVCTFSFICTCMCVHITKCWSSIGNTYILDSMWSIQYRFGRMTWKSFDPELYIT